VFRDGDGKIIRKNRKLRALGPDLTLDHLASYSGRQVQPRRQVRRATALGPKLNSSPWGGMFRDLGIIYGAIAIFAVIAVLALVFAILAIVFIFVGRSVSDCQEAKEFERRMAERSSDD
jgi:hypothetical protein